MAKRVMMTTMVTVLIGLFFSFLAAMSLHHSESLSIRHEVEKDVENAALSLGREVNSGIELLHMMRNHFEGKSTVEVDDFKLVARDISSRHPDIVLIDWVEFGIEDDRLLPSFNPQFSLPQTAKAAFLIEGISENKELLMSLQTSGEKGVPIALASVPLQEEYRDSTGLLITMPVYRGRPETDAERMSSLKGVLSVTFDMGDMFKQAISNTVGEAINLELIGHQIGGDTEVIHQNLVALFDEGIREMTYTSSSIKFAGLEWSLRGLPTRDYVSERRSLYPQIIFVVGMVIFSLLSYILYILQFRAMNIQKRVDEKTRALREANLKLEQISRSDSLTGHYNRRYFDECLDSEVGRSQRDGIPISMMVIEVDNLSEYNETCGRVAGDKAIRLISQEMKESLCRPGDLFARYGGQQFAILLPNTNDGEPVASRISKVVKSLGFFFDNDRGNLGLTISIGGVTVVDPRALSSSKLSAYAEIALNKAIAAGRDTVHWIDEPEKN
ncbi:diguanylate cyclase [Veronia nyctiphanis]|uniref:diguanylate cyclase n=1 Tax=Veronia nyctiphanis TaxID=1278244 RepID=A0A4Q0YVN0_9GAMM|nr:sensor domain-containing diguanylate cyclase [Veronia nyctiphanis]RXJ74953.1 diguanylate cyclase [Veronia nyctiphanis]